MLHKMRSVWKKLTGGSSLLRSDYSTESKQHMENYDAVTARNHASSDGGYNVPSNYVRPVDESRPQK
jgi:hypothetical protein